MKYPIIQGGEGPTAEAVDTSQFAGVMSCDIWKMANLQPTLRLHVHSNQPRQSEAS